LTTPSSNAFWPERTALFVAHPGHELRIWHWLETVRPTACVLTDGSGRKGISRVAVTERLLAEAGARPGQLFGEITDRQLYEAVLTKRCELFRKLVDRWTAQLVAGRIECVVGDAAEGQIMAHDILREVRIEGVKRASALLGRPIAEYEFTIDSHPSFVPLAAAEQCRRLTLGPDALRRKIEVARGYTEVVSFVAEALDRCGEEAFGAEYLFPSLPGSCLPADRSTPLPYEKHGEEQVRQGNYDCAIRYAEHVEPIVRAIQAPPQRVAA
jgi:hypothetical protein